MATVTAKAFRVTDSSRELLQSFIQEQIPAETKYVLASPEGYLFFNEEPALVSGDGHIRIPSLTMLSYYTIQYESE